MPREKTMKVVFAFPTTTMAMKMEAAAKAKEAPGRLIPVPRQISAGCGMAWAAPAEAKTHGSSITKDAPFFKAERVLAYLFIMAVSPR